MSNARTAEVTYHPMPPRSPAAGAAQTNVPPFRRSSIAPRRRRPSRLAVALRRLGPPLALLGLPALVAAWLLTSPRFALEAIEVTGTGRVPAAWVEEALAPLAGENLLRLHLAEVDARLRGHPWVEGVSIRKQLPASLVVAVVERQPRARVPRGDELWYADARGGLIAPVAAGEAAAAGLPLVRSAEPTDGAGRAGAVPRALAALEALREAQPRWAEGLVALEVLGEDDFRLETSALPFPVIFGTADLAAKSRRLDEVLPEILARYDALAAVDLRFSRRIVLTPGGGQDEISTKESSAHEA